MYIFIEDPSHGYLRVPREELKQLGIQKKITSFSFRDSQYVYLEEDLDAETFIKAKYPNNYPARRRFYRDCKCEHYEHAYCRELRRYNKSKEEREYNVSKPKKPEPESRSYLSTTSPGQTQ